MRPVIAKPFGFKQFRAQFFQPLTERCPCSRWITAGTCTARAKTSPYVTRSGVALMPPVAPDLVFCMAPEPHRFEQFRAEFLESFAKDGLCRERDFVSLALPPCHQVPDWPTCVPQA
jgi:hypothetical protein